MGEGRKESYNISASSYRDEVCNDSLPDMMGTGMRNPRARRKIGIIGLGRERSPRSTGVDVNFKLEKTKRSCKSRDVFLHGHIR